MASKKPADANSDSSEKAAKPGSPKKESAKASAEKKPAAAKKTAGEGKAANGHEMSPFLVKQKENLLTLKDTLLDSMSGVARDSLRNGGDTESAFGMHQADAGSDAYDRDFALSLLSQEQDALYEIDEALKRIEAGTYGVCEMSGKQIPKARLEALPFTRYTVECQAEIEKRNRYQRYHQPVTSLFGLGDDESDSDEDDNSLDTKD